jgi:CHAT domain-containing protein
VLISPDAELGKLPFAALPGKTPGTYLLEEYSLAAVPAASVMAAPARQAEPADNLLVLGGVDYNSRQASEAVNKPKRQFAARAPREGAGDFEPLPGTTGELATIKTLYESSFGPTGITMLSGQAATQNALVQLAPQHRYLHLATHGYFASPRFKSALGRSTQESDRGREAFVSDQSLAGYHPGLLSGIVLAGANQPAEEDDGILTAEEVGALHLNGCELVVLSACETGLGQAAGGEGLLGLQRSFQAAGAKTVIASLWKVDDAATRDLMERFYDNLWSKTKEDGQTPLYTKLAALREAQLWMLKERGPRGATPTEADLATAGESRLPPYYWAAFVLSGDWR